MMKKCDILFLILTIGSCCYALPDGYDYNMASEDGLVVLSNRIEEISRTSRAGYLRSYYVNHNVWTTQWHSLETPLDHSSFAGEISDDGTVISGNIQYDLPRAIDRRSAVIWNYSVDEDDYSMQLLDVVGDYDNSKVQTMSDNGQYFIGYLSTYEPSSMAGCYWDRDGSIHLLDSVSENVYFTVGYDVSNDGVIVGTEGLLDGSPQYAFIWDAEHGTRDLKDVLINEYGYDFADYHLSQAFYINSEGTYIYGDGYDPAGNQIHWEVTIPEPATLLLFGLGGLVLRRQHL